MDFGYFFTPQIFFNLTPGTWLQYGFFVFIASIIVLFIGIICKIVYYFAPLNDVYKRLFEKVSTLFLTIGSFALFFWFARQQRIALFAARFWWVVLLVSAIIWLYFIIRGVIRFNKNKQEYLQKKKVYLDYLPGKK